MQHAGLNLEAWFARVDQPVVLTPAIGEANPAGPLAAEVHAFVVALAPARALSRQGAGPGAGRATSSIRCARSA
jgi:hypothetical protein